MIFKINKDKQNSKTQRTLWAPYLTPSSADHKNRMNGNTAPFNMTLHNHNKLFKKRRNSNLNHLTLQNVQIDPLQTISAKRMSLFSYNERSKKKNCRSANNCYEKSILQESNFDILKQQARKLDEDFPTCALQRWKPSLTKPFVIHDKSEKCQNVSLLQSIKKSKKNNMRKIIKGRPEIKKLLVENRQKILKQKIIDYTDECVFTEQQDIKASSKCQEGQNYQSVLLHTIL